MGNPSLGSKVQTTMSLPKGRHRPSLSLGSSLESKLAPHEKLSRSVEKQLASSTTVSPRKTEEKSIAAFLGDKKVKRRTRSSLGGSEEFIKGFELNGVAMAAEERKPLSSIPFRGKCLYCLFSEDIFGTPQSLTLGMARVVSTRIQVCKSCLLGDCCLFT